VRSALVTAMMRALVEELKEMAGDPGKLLTRLNQDIVAMLRPTGTPILTTAICLMVDLDAGQFLYANAGHPRPFLVRRQTAEILHLGESRKQMGPALGLFPDSTYVTTPFRIKAGDTVMLFTDGVCEVEGADGAFYDRDLLHKSVTRNVSLATPELFDRLLQEIREFSVHQRFEDDVCLLGVDIVG
jgi:serine phosphatase RsbU (regulator of sigma subunit)